MSVSCVRILLRLAFHIHSDQHSGRIHFYKGILYTQCSTQPAAESIFYKGISGYSNIFQVYTQERKTTCISNRNSKTKAF